MTNKCNSYKLAEKLQDRLNELNKDLTEMIEEINTTSQTLSKSGKPDDPVSFVLFYRSSRSRLTTENSSPRSSAFSTRSSHSSSSSTRAPCSCRTRSRRRRRRARASVAMDGTAWAPTPPRTSTEASAAGGRSVLAVFRRLVECTCMVLGRIQRAVILDVRVCAGRSD